VGLCAEKGLENDDAVPSGNVNRESIHRGDRGVNNSSPGAPLVQNSLWVENKSRGNGDVVRTQLSLKKGRKIPLQLSLSGESEREQDRAQNNDLLGKIRTPGRKVELPTDA